MGTWIEIFHKKPSTRLDLVDAAALLSCNWVTVKQNVKMRIKRLQSVLLEISFPSLMIMIIMV